MIPRNQLVPILLLIASVSQGQQIDSLELIPPSNKSISCVFELLIPDKEGKRIRSSSGRKMTIKEPVLLFNGDTLKTVSVKTRGKTSLTFSRKSMSVSLSDPITVQGQEIKKFVLLGLQMDKNYWRNRLSFILMNRLDLFPLKNMYSEFRINKESQGIYLFVHKADDYVKQIDSPILLRRVEEGKYEIDFKKGEDAKDLLKNFQKGRSLPNKYKGKELSEAIDKVLDLNQYLEWLAFNFLVMNGDYADEVFFYHDHINGQFRIIPWDYDDIFSSQPHEGWELRRLTIGHDLLFSGEAYLDRSIDRDDYLYFLYLEEFRSMLSEINPSVIKTAFEQLYSELYPFYMEPEVINQSEYDASGITNVEQLQQDLKTHYSFLIRRHTSILRTIKKQ